MEEQKKYQFLFEAIRHFSSSLDIAVASQRLLRILNQMIPIDLITFGVYEPEMKGARQIVAATLEKAKCKEIFIPLSDEDIKVKNITNLGKPRVMDNVYREQLKKDTKSRIIEMLPLEKFESISVLTFPLTIEGNWIGSLACFAMGEDRYKNESIDWLVPLQEPLALVLNNALQYREVKKLQEMLAEDNQYLRQELRQATGGEIIGQNSGLKLVMEMVRQVAPVESPILLNGETGTGKELIANAIHYSSTRRNGPFIAVNCGAIPETLVDTELFGHEKGAFTGAVEQKRGRFERANGGTIFLDEIGDLSLSSQVKLLRVLQQKEIERVGGTETIHLDIRVIAATNRNLDNMVRENTFREDLLYRLSVFPIRIPPLRQRKMDIPKLVGYFLEKKAREMKVTKDLQLESGTMERLVEYEWKGNIRELENVIERAIIRSQHGILRIGKYLTSEAPVDSQIPLTGINPVFTLDEVARRHIETMLKQAKGKIAGPGGCAELLQVSPSTLRSRMKKLGILFKKDLG